MKRAEAGVWSRHQTASRSMSSVGTAANRHRSDEGADPGPILGEPASPRPPRPPGRPRPPPGPRPSAAGSTRIPPSSGSPGTRATGRRGPRSSGDGPTPCRAATGTPGRAEHDRSRRPIGLAPDARVDGRQRHLEGRRDHHRPVAVQPDRQQDGAGPIEPVAASPQAPRPGPRWPPGPGRGGWSPSGRAGRP